MKVKAYLGIGYHGANHESILEIPDSELECMTEEEREDYINEYVQEWANNYIEVGYEVIE